MVTADFSLSTKKVDDVLCRGRHAAGIAVSAAVLGLVAGCGGSSSPSANNTPSSNPVQSISPSRTPSPSVSLTPEEQQVKTNFEKFFSATDLDTRVKLLQNGEQFRQLLQQEAQATKGQQPTAVVHTVTITDPTHANVTYAVLLGGSPSPLTNQPGEALKINGTWVVSDASFCGLLSLAGTAPPICSAAGGSSASPSASASASG